jgi:hypothetical protein
MMQAFKLAALAAALVATATAQAVTYSSSSTEPPEASGASFHAVGGDLVLKTLYGVSGAGVTGGRTNDEIDIGEQIVASFARPVIVTGIQLAFLYDGPEFNDVQERAQITATFADLTSVSYTLSAMFPDTYAWNGMGSITGPASNTEDSGGFWTLSNPFGQRGVTGLSFTALEGLCGSGPCDNQSDYALASLSTAPVPEPETYALMLVGLAGVGAAARQRRKA